jgi:hypothetical protein
VSPEKEITVHTSARSALRILLAAAVVGTTGTLASLTVNSNPVAFTPQTVKGIAYAVFPAASGSYVATHAP